MAVAVKVGSWGPLSGEAQDIAGERRPQRLESITIYISEAPRVRVCGFSLVYVDQNGEHVLVGPWGMPNHNPQIIPFVMNPGEYVNSMSGTFDDEGITSLKFTTNQDRDYGPNGREMGTAFSVPRPDYSKEDGGDGNGAVVGFFGASGGSLTAIGFYVSVPGKNDGPVKVGPWCGFGGRAPYDVPPYGDLPGVTVATSGQRIRAVEGTNESEGQGQPPDFVHFYLGEGEYIKDMAGSSDDHGVTSLTFTTNQNTVHGPFGQRLGTDFSVPLPDDNGAVVGFVCYDGNAIAAYIGLPPDPAHPARPRVE